MQADDSTVDRWLDSGRSLLASKIEEFSRYPRLADLLQSSSSSEYTLPLVTDWHTFVQSKSIQLPDAVFNNYNLLNSNCFMGLFPEIRRAWITVDHRLFIWNYEEENDFYNYEDQDQLIVSVALVKPKKNIFSKEIQHVLVIATTLEIILLGVGIDTKSSVKNGQLSLYSTQLKVSTDNIIISSIIGSDNGRIFYSGNDGHIYEIIYQESDGWLTKKCRKICLTSNVASYFIPTFLSINNDDQVVSFAIDNERSILYMLTQKSALEVVWLGENSDEFERIIQHKGIFSESAMLSPVFGYETKENFEIVSIHVIPKSESETIHLVAITSFGTRLYFATQKRTNWIKTTPKKKAETLELVHVRRPKLKSGETIFIHNGLYENGATILASAKTDDSDVLIGCLIDNGIIQQSVIRHGKSGLVEWESEIPIEGKTWDIASVNHERNSDLNDMNTIDCLSHEKYIILTNSGINEYLKQRPLDMVLWLLGKGSIIESEVTAIIENFGRVEMCAMCLTVLSADESSQRSLGALTVKNCSSLFFEFGGSPHIRTSVAMAAQLVGKPGVPQVVFSGRHDGLLLFLARLLKDIWNSSVLKLVEFKDKQTCFELNVSLEKLQKTQARLSRLITFINRNQNFIPDLSRTSINQGMDPYPSDSFNFDANAVNSNCWQLEADSLFGLYRIAQQTVEAISFLFILMDFNKSVIAGDIDESIKVQLSKMSLSEITTSPAARNLCRELVISMISGRISKSEMIESISEVLEKKCGSYFSKQDVKLYRALEYLRVAQSLNESNSEPEQQRALLHECLEMFIESGMLLGEKKLKECATVFCGFNWNIGAMGLCLGCAKTSDPTDSALVYYEKFISQNLDHQDPSTAIDSIESSKKIYEWRLFCYNIALNLIGNTEETINSNLLSHALSSSDFLFHLTLYGFLMHNKMGSVLVQVHSPFLIDYLRMEPATIEKYELLWRHLVFLQKYTQASFVLHNLASGIPISNISLSKRLEYLSLAISNAKSSLHYEPTELPITSMNQMTDQLKTAQIQMEILLMLKSRSDQKENVEKLNSKLYNVTELYDLNGEGYENTPSQNSLVAVSSKVSSLGSRLFPSDSAFPLDLIVGIMTILVSSIEIENLREENEKWENVIAPGFIAQTLIDCGASCSAIFSVFCEFLDSLLDNSKSVELIGTSTDLAVTSGLLSTPYGLLTACINRRNEVELGGVDKEISVSEYSVQLISSILINEVVYLVKKWVNFSNTEPTNNQDYNNQDYDNNQFPVVAVADSLSKYVISANGIVDQQIISKIQFLQNDIRILF
ncbi:hypothetical protein BB559_005997 [Furculomyces boomerangus]|uniref:Nucleoporin Nup133/Nup155-like N-terminal domain-containing protein n=1 Tax=Furculomyces boomerangus TaxID=61424 RepID=A0A2T9Y5B7_9FUNG|nr:hypothetical protein BB559_005997 [Furculomyces boomerangus]